MPYRLGMRSSRIAGWLECRSASFEAGRAHDENLAYLLGQDYVPALGWNLSRDVFRSVVAALAEVEECLIIRAIVPLEVREELTMDRVDSVAEIERQLDVLAPPMIVVMPPAFAAYDERKFERYEIAVTLGDSSLPGIARYEAFRGLAFDSSGSWQRCVTLEAQTAACRYVGPERRPRPTSSDRGLQRDASVE